MSLKLSKMKPTLLLMARHISRAVQLKGILTFATEVGVDASALFGVLERKRRFRTLLHWLRISGLDNLLDRRMTTRCSHQLKQPLTKWYFLVSKRSWFKIMVVIYAHHLISGKRSTDDLTMAERASTNQPIFKFERGGAMTQSKGIVRPNVDADRLSRAGPFWFH